MPELILKLDDGEELVFEKNQVQMFQNSASRFEAAGHEVGPLGDLADSLCIPDEVIGETLGDLVCERLRSNPEVRHASAATITWGTIVRAYCPDKLSP